MGAAFDLVVLLIKLTLFVKSYNFRHLFMFAHPTPIFLSFRNRLRVKPAMTKAYVMLNLIQHLAMTKKRPCRPLFLLLHRIKILIYQNFHQGFFAPLVVKPLAAAPAAVLVTLSFLAPF